MNPYLVLKLDPASVTDESIRQRYLELVKQYPPQRSPEKFARIEKAYNLIKDARLRAAWELGIAFSKSEHPSELLKDIDWRFQRNRITSTLLAKLIQNR
jgi:curved DNA-binding protein CbpA